jgi:hypothetical protein
MYLNKYHYYYLTCHPKSAIKGKEFSDICSYIKDKCDELKENNVSVAETID